MYSKEQLIAIFRRIGMDFDEEHPRDFSLVADIMYGCQKNIPYENLDILSGKPLSLDYGDLYRKIVDHRRGGYCFELNGFLGEIYRSMGFPVKEFMGRYLRGETEIPMRRHRVVCVKDESGREWICDAGVGQAAFRVPLALEEGYLSEQYGETYKVEKEEFLGWVIYDLHKGEWRRFYSFTEEEQLNIDYVMPSFWCEHAPESPFISKANLAIKTDTGRYTFDGTFFRIFDGDQVKEIRPAPEEIPAYFSQYFGLSVD